MIFFWVSLSLFKMALTNWKCQSAVSTLFFDLDNTLINTRKGDKEACEKVNRILIKTLAVHIFSLISR